MAPIKQVFVCGCPSSLHEHLACETKCQPEIWTGAVEWMRDKISFVLRPKHVWGQVLQWLEQTWWCRCMSQLRVSWQTAEHSRESEELRLLQLACEATEVCKSPSNSNQVLG